ncbi:MAG: MSCRAMM family protein, partial [Acidimicrobiales bacterium]
MAFTTATEQPAFGDGPAPCSVGGPPYPFQGFCATYSGDNTWYGSYGPGFPTAEGWAFCADPPASGGYYPAPVYDYVGSGPPAGSNTSEASALGFAFSEAQALGWWDGLNGQFTAAQAAVAGKLLYDSVVWSDPTPGMDPGVLAAFEALHDWYLAAVGSSGAPQLSVSLSGGTTSFRGNAELEISATFPGTARPAAGLSVEVSVTGGTLGSVGGSSSVTVGTDDSGDAAIGLFAAEPGPVAVSVSVPDGVGQSGLTFWSPSAFEPRAQQLAAFFAPEALQSAGSFTALPTTGTVSIVKGGDDTAYYPLAGAVFDVQNSSGVQATLTTGPGGTTGTTPGLAAGTYTIHEALAPPGYGTAPDQQVTVRAGTNTVISFTGAEEDHVSPATLTIDKADAQTASPLKGAVFQFSYDQDDTGVFDRFLGTCTTGMTGSCSPDGNDGSSLVPGRYQVTEISAPPGYATPNPATQVVDLLPGENAVLKFGDVKLVSAVFQKVATGNINPAELTLSGAVIVVYQGAVGGSEATRCTTDRSGTCVTGLDLDSGVRYCWREMAAPPGLSPGATGCFVADEDQADEPITVTDPGLFVTIQVKKVDAASLSTGLSQARFDLYRVSALLPSVLPYPVGATQTGEQLVASTTTGPGGLGTFPMQLPGFVYCAQEVEPPPNYIVETSQQCTGLLEGTTEVPAPVTTLDFEDSEQMVHLSVFKYDSLTPT